jgi:hypothetical protein
LPALMLLPRIQKHLFPRIEFHSSATDKYMKSVFVRWPIE